MHIYFYDAFVNQKKYDTALARIETRITDLGLNGKIIRLGLTNSIDDNVEREVKKGAKTITVVGNDALVNKAVNAVARLEAANIIHKPVPVGIIPVGKKNNRIAEYLGIKHEEGACDILSARRIQRTDLGLVNDRYFLTHVIIGGRGTSVEIDGHYSVEVDGAGSVEVVNLPVGLELPPGTTKADDGVLELFIKTAGAKKIVPARTGNNKESVFVFKKLRISNKTMPVIVDGVMEIKTPVEINIAKEKIQLIVGRDRRF